MFDSLTEEICELMKSTETIRSTNIFLLVIFYLSHPFHVTAAQIIALCLQVESWPKSYIRLS